MATKRAAAVVDGETLRARTRKRASVRRDETQRRALSWLAVTLASLEARVLALETRGAQRPSAGRRRSPRG